MSPTDRTALQRLPERGSQDPTVVKRVLDAAFVGHVGFHAQSQTYVIPMIYGRDDDALYLHGSTSSRLLGGLCHRKDACVSVTLIDGLVLAKVVRLAAAFGKCRFSRIAASMEPAHAWLPCDLETWPICRPALAAHLSAVGDLTSQRRKNALNRSHSQRASFRGVE